MARHGEQIVNSMRRSIEVPTSRSMSTGSELLAYFRFDRYKLTNIHFRSVGQPLTGNDEATRFISNKFSVLGPLTFSVNFCCLHTLFEISALDGISYGDQWLENDASYRYIISKTHIAGQIRIVWITMDHFAASSLNPGWIREHSMTNLYEKREINVIHMSAGDVFLTFFSLRKGTLIEVPIK